LVDLDVWLTGIEVQLARIEKSVEDMTEDEDDERGDTAARRG
jgi:hypothetical protein